MSYIFKRIFGTRKIAQDLRPFTALIIECD